GDVAEPGDELAGALLLPHRRLPGGVHSLSLGSCGGADPAHGGACSGSRSSATARTLAANAILLNVRGHCAAKKSANAWTVIEVSAFCASSRERLPARYDTAQRSCSSRVIDVRF